MATQTVDVKITNARPIKATLQKAVPINATLRKSQPINVELTKTGAPGLSAYEIWLAAGNVGSEQDFLDSLKGADGSGGDLHFTQSFTGLSYVVVEHNLNKRPAVSVLDSANDEVVGTVEHLDANSLIVTFSAPFSGIIICN